MPEKEESVKEFVTRNLGEEVRNSRFRRAAVGGRCTSLGPQKVPCFLHVEYWRLGVHSCTIFIDFPLF